MNSHRLAIKYSLLLILVGGPFTVCATPYTDEAAWRAAVGNVFAFENFDAITPGTDVGAMPGLGIKFDPLDDGTQPTVQKYASTGGIVRSGPNNLLNDRDIELPGRGPYNIRAINAADLIFGVGVWNIGGDDTLRMTYYDELNQIIEQVVSAFASGFFGIVNPLGAARAQIDFVGGNGFAPVDDLQTAVRQQFDAVPEPGTFALTLLALAAMARARRRAA